MNFDALLLWSISYHNYTAEDDKVQLKSVKPKHLSVTPSGVSYCKVTISSTIKDGIRTTTSYNYTRQKERWKIWTGNKFLKWTTD